MGNILTGLRAKHTLKQTIGLLALLVIGLGAVGGGVYAALGGSIKPAATSDVDLQKGLIAHWKLDGNGKDSTPFGRSLSLYSSPGSVADRKNKAASALSFNGSTQDSGIANFDTSVLSSGSYSAKWTLSIWAKGGTQGTDKILLGKPGCNGGIITNASGAYQFAIFNSDCTGASSIVSSTVDGTAWHLLTATYDAGTMKFYMDGALIGSSFASSIFNYPSDMCVGGYVSYRYAGSLDDARVYNRVLNAAEAEALYDQYDPGLQSAAGEKGLIGQWNMDGNAKDDTPNGNNGTVSGASVASDRKNQANKAYSFPGSGANNISLGNSTLFNSSNITMSSWVKPTSTSGTRTIMAKELQYKVRIMDSDISVLVSLNGSSWAFNQTFGITIPPGSWYLITTTISSATNEVTVYVNGSSIGTKSLGGSIASYNTNGFYIGAYSSGGEEPFQGSIDDVRIYNRVLSSAEIAAQYGAYDSRVQVSDLQKGLVGDWPLNGSAKDATPYANNGTVTGGATLTTDRKGTANSAYSFNGTSQYIDTGLVQTSVSSYTAAAWVKITSSGTNSAIVQNRGTGPGRSLTLAANANAAPCAAVGEISYGLDSDGTYIGVTTDATFNDSTWHHIVAVWNGTSGVNVAASQFTIYVDGAAVPTSACTYGTAVAAPLTGSGTTKIGYHQAWNGYFPGSLDDVRIYNRALNSTEVIDLYKRYR